MRHGYDTSDEGGAEGATPQDWLAWAAKDVQYLAGLLQPAWLERQKKLSPEKWAANARFALTQAIDSARFSLRAGNITDEQKAKGFAVVKQARELLEHTGVIQ